MRRAAATILGLIGTWALPCTICYSHVVQGMFWRGPSLCWDFTSNPVLPSQLTFTRGSTAYYYNSSGTLTSAAANTPRFDYDPSTLTAKGLLMEASATNQLKYSASALTTAPWANTAVTVTLNSTTAPDGTTTAAQVVVNTANSQHTIQQSTAASLAAGTVITASIYAKESTGRYVRLLVQDDSTYSNGTYADFDLTSVTATSGTPFGNATITASGIQTIGNGWYRIWLTGKFSTTATGAQMVADIITSIGGATSYTGNGTTSMYYWGAQLETGAVMTSFIASTSSAGTRSADQATFNTMSWYNPGAGTLFAKFINMGGENAATYRVFGLFNTNVAGTFANDDIDLSDSGTTNKSQAIAGGVAQLSGSGAMNAANTANTLAFSYGAGNLAYQVNVGGSGMASGVTMPAAAAYAYIGSQPDGNMRSRWIQKIRYYNQRLPSANLANLQ